MADAPQLRYEDRVFITGTTSSGKSTLARQLFLASAAPRLVIDPANSSLTETPGAVTFSDPRRSTNSRGESWRDAATARFVPRDPYDLEAYSDLYDWAFANLPRWVWCDEAGYVFPSSGGQNRGGRRALAQGRKFGLGHLACHTRPRWVTPDLVANAAHVLVFSTPNAQDRAYLADNMGVPRSLFEGAHREMLQTPYSYLWWQQRRQELMICEPHPRGA